MKIGKFDVIFYVCSMQMNPLPLYKIISCLSWNHERIQHGGSIEKENHLSIRVKIQVKRVCTNETLLIES